MRSILAAVALALAPMVALAQSGLEGDWHGPLTTTRGTTVRIVLHLGATSTMDSPDQGALGIPATLTGTPADATVAVPAMGGALHLALSPDGSTLSGTLSQGGVSRPITLQRGAGAPPRPQTPRPPYPYREVEARYPNPKAPGVMLAGTLTIPAGPGPFPAVLLITGSGGQDRDETIADHKPFLVLADALTRRGVAVLRVDDRGVGGSTGAGPRDTTADFETDVEAGLGWLRTRSEIDTARIGLLGHSEGGTIAIMAAAHDPKVAFVVLMAGPGVSGRDNMVEQVRLLSLAGGRSAEDAGRTASLQGRLLDAMMAAPDEASAQAAGLKVAHEALGPQAGAEIPLMASPWYRFMLAYDPAADLKSIKAPILAVNGAKDVQVSARQSLAAIKAAHPAATTVELPGLNHLFQDAQTGLPAEYGAITETLSPQLLKTVGDWIVATVGASGRSR